ncbi:MAG: mechanosensitive ion channel [Candidatus Delongbacteria bacterium]|nr:mechanosensitive ion channel [Candidatus Delongbacteria bacterium]MBN2833523.1 mechanosensitive ion channel [Candidatus Delongbacteria bacterium]
MENIIWDYLIGFDEAYPIASMFAKTILILILAWISNYIAKKIVYRIIKKVVEKSKNRWDDVLLSNNVFDNLIKIVPGSIIYLLSYLIPEFSMVLSKFSLVYICIVLILSLSSFLKAVNELYDNSRYAEGRSIKGIIQIINMILILLGIIMSIAILMGKSPLVLLSGIGAMTAIVMLIFKDTILSFVASLQIVFTNIVKVGDWITMPSCGADGDVIEIALHTIKVQNFDKTIVTIPTYKLIDGSFTNWRGMSDSGVRRIKRAINIDMSTIKFLNSDDYKKLQKLGLLKDYFVNKQKELDEYNKKYNDDDLSQRRTLTNIGTFRAYISEYLKNHQKIDKEKTFLIRQLQPSSEGVPLEVYVFSNDNRWIQYEEIQSDIFDHLLAIIPEFDLKVFQNPSGNDFKNMLK